MNKSQVQSIKVTESTKFEDLWFILQPDYLILLKNIKKYFSFKMTLNIIHCQLFHMDKLKLKILLLIISRYINS